MGFIESWFNQLFAGSKLRRVHLSLTVLYLTVLANLCLAEPSPPSHLGLRTGDIYVVERKTNPKAATLYDQFREGYTHIGFVHIKTEGHDTKICHLDVPQAFIGCRWDDKTYHFLRPNLSSKQHQELVKQLNEINTAQLPQQVDLAEVSVSSSLGSFACGGFIADQLKGFYPTNIVPYSSFEARWDSLMSGIAVNDETVERTILQLKFLYDIGLDTEDAIRRLIDFNRSHWRWFKGWIYPSLRKVNQQKFYMPGDFLKAARQKSDSSNISYLTVWSSEDQ